MTELRDCTDPDTWDEPLQDAAAALGAGGLVVLPTDTVYGVAADAFTPASVGALLQAKGRDRQKPPPVLISDVMTMEALATDVPPEARALAEAYWPGPLTIILIAQPSLMWDLGETRGTVALRVPDHPCALELLRRTGPLAVSSANLTGEDPAVECQEARTQLGEAVQVYLDAGRTPGQVPSTIIDCTGRAPRVLREGAISLQDLRSVVEGVIGLAPSEDETGAGADAAPDAGGEDRGGADTA